LAHPLTLDDATYESEDALKMENQSATSDQSTTVLGRIVGARLTSVDFVLNYLILGFDEKGALTSLVWPEVSIGGGQVLRYGMQGYRDALCNLITRVVSEANISEDEIIQITLADDYVRIPLREKQGAGERAILTGLKHFLHVW
jgi:hypothetical protein